MRAARAGIDEATAHGLRKVGATRAADNGATVHELMALFGWRTEKEALVYTEEANRRRLAEQAADKLIANDDRTDFSRTYSSGAGAKAIS